MEFPYKLFLYYLVVTDHYGLQQISYTMNFCLNILENNKYNEAGVFIFYRNEMLKE